MPFAHARTIRLPDTDAAGVVYFAHTLSICHEAYEESLIAAGIPLRDLLGATGIAVPIAKSEAGYLRPLRVGDKISISVTPEFISDTSFAVSYEITKLGTVGKLSARARTEHVCISMTQQERAPLPPALLAWVRAG